MSTKPSTTPRRRPTLATVTGRPATQAERDATMFKPIPGALPCRDEWERYLPTIRTAELLLGLSPEELKLSFTKLAATASAANWLELLAETKHDIEVVAKMLDATLARSFLVLERLGYSPDNPPA